MASSPLNPPPAAFGKFTGQRERQQHDGESDSGDDAGLQVVVHGASKCLTARSHVMLDTRSRPACPSRSASGKSSMTSRSATASVSGRGAQTFPFLSSTTSSAGPPLSVQVMTGLRDANASTVTKP